MTANQQRHPSSPQVSYSTTLWYCCLENLSSFRLGFIAKHLLHFSFQSNNTCGVCALAKQHRLSFPISSILSIRPFELIHCDIWRLYKVAFFSSSKYFFDYSDDYSQFTWIFFMNHKSKIQNLYHDFFFSFVQTQFHVSIANIRVDNEGEISLCMIF